MPARRTRHLADCANRGQDWRSGSARRGTEGLAR